jgi:hypothetical protein
MPRKHGELTTKSEGDTNKDVWRYPNWFIVEIKIHGARVGWWGRPLVKEPMTYLKSWDIRGVFT